MSNAKEVQIGGSHYKSFKIQPLEFCQANRIPYCESNVIKYVCRHASKGKAQDIFKAIHNMEFLLEMEYPEEWAEELKRRNEKFNKTFPSNAVTLTNDQMFDVYENILRNSFPDKVAFDILESFPAKQGKYILTDVGGKILGVFWYKGCHLWENLDALGNFKSGDVFWNFSASIYNSLNPDLDQVISTRMPR
jgi:hypothetical protein